MAASVSSDPPTRFSAAPSTESASLVAAKPTVDGNATNTEVTVRYNTGLTLVFRCKYNPALSPRRQRQLSAALTVENETIDVDVLFEDVFIDTETMKIHCNSEGQPTSAFTMDPLLYKMFRDNHFVP